MEWVIIDDSKNINTEFANLEQDNIKYIYHPESFSNIAEKRNFGVENCKFDYISIMDDDDYHFNDSLLAKIRCLLFYKKDCIFSTPIAVYNTISHTSQILETYSKISPPEATMAFSKKFWTKGKFIDRKEGEGYGMVLGRENEALKIPFIFNCICFTHKSNVTKDLRNIKIDENNKFSNFYDSFEDDLKQIIQDIYN